VRELLSESDYRKLVRECLEGNSRAQEQLANRFRGLCRHVAVRTLGETGSSHLDDVVQESLAAVFQNLEQWQGKNLPAWIGTIAARRAIDYRRRQDRRADQAAAKADFSQLKSEPPEPRPPQSDMVDLLDSLRKALSHRQQRILDGMLNGRERDALAAELGISQRTLYYELGEIEAAIQETRDSSAKASPR
jgi:RNA polymerase sigma factor (sigma-70 family)